MRIKFLKQLLWVLNTVFVLAIVAIALRYFLLGGPKMTGPRTAEKLLPPLPEGGGKIKGDGKLPSASYSVIWELAIHGMPPPPPDPIVPGKVEKTIPPLARDYDLGWTLVDEHDPWQSYAHLIKKADPTTAVNAPLGYMVEGVWKVIRVDNWEAEFEQEDSGETVVLKMARTATDGMVRSVADAGTGQQSNELVIGEREKIDPETDYKMGPQRGRAIKVGTNHYQLGQGEVQWWDRNGEKVLEEVALQEEKDENGRPAGVRIRGFSDSSMLKARGLLPGDVVKSLNGTSVNSKQEAVAYVKGPGKDATRFIVVVERKGQLVTFTYDRPTR